MPGARNYPSEAVVRRYVTLAKELGMEPGGIEVAPDGRVRVLPKAAAAPVANDDALFDKWEGKL